MPIMVRGDGKLSLGYAMAIIPAAVLMVVLLGYPMMDFLLASFSSEGGVLDYYLAIFRSPVDRYVLLTTFKIASITTLLTVILGYPVALVIASARPAIARILLLVVLMPFWTSVLVRTYSWLVLLGRRGLVNNALQSLGLIETPLSLLFNLTGVLIGMVHILLPYMVLPLWSVIVRLDRDIFLAAESLGARSFQVFWRILLPLTLPGMVGGSVLVFTAAISFYITPALLGGRKEVMAPMLIVERVTTRLAWGEASAVAFLLLAVTLACFAMCGKILRPERLFGMEMDR